MKSMKCSRCDRPALIHVTEINYSDDGGSKEVRDVHLCLFHAVDAGLVAGLPKGVISELASEDDPLSLAQLTAATTLAAGSKKKRSGAGKQLTCPICGSTWGDFEKSGLMGCPHDIETFESKLVDVIKGLHEGRTQHVGKVPTRSGSSTAALQGRITRLQEKLSLALKQEDYERAALLRDELRTLQPPG